ncbi:MAG: PKD domain-containing protein, partial [Candidatus Poseidonia sp.]|nr:PKD domain-containing protein [Poseidonia sp.]
MNRRPRLFMGTMLKSILMAALMLCSSMAGCLFEDDSSGSSDEVLAVFSYSPSKNIRASDTVTFDASDSTPSDGSLTYRWNFDAVNSIDIDATGQQATWSFDEAGTFEVKLEVSDGSTTSEQTRDITIVEASAQPPVASITQYADSEDCEDESITENSNIVLWICARDKSTTDRSVTETTTVELDASDSEAGDSAQYIADDGYVWDLDLNEDKDNDGDSENDDDLVGQTVDWTNVPPGEYEISLTVTNDVGMTDSDTIRVYVSYAGYWSDFEIGANSTSGAAEIDFDVTIHYNKETANTVRKVVAELEYPQQDDDWIAGGSSQQNRNVLDIYAFNEEDEEASNTSGT